jgi:hypothetical protein
MGTMVTKTTMGAKVTMATHKTCSFQDDWTR